MIKPSVRNDFPILKRTMCDQPLIYFDNGATTLKPQPVIDAVMHYYTYLGANAHRGDYEMSAQVDQAYESARDAVKQFIHAKCREEIVFTSGTTDGLNQIAWMVSNQVLKEGDVILSSQSEHASDTLPWMRAAKDKGLTIRYIPLDQGKITLENVKSVWDEKVKLVALAQVSNVLGYQAPIKEIAAFAHQNHALMVVDAAQSAPHIPIDVQDLDVDFLAFSAHKMCGPTGIGVLYGKLEWLEQLTPMTSGGESNARYDKEGNISLKKSPLKYESGTQPIEGAIGLRAAIDYLSALGLEAIHQHEIECKRYFLEQVGSLDHIIVYNPQVDSGICTFNVTDQGKMIPAQDVASYLNTRGIAVR
ncbi:MAG: aminotransferase class V-fold PLP-dependent enzyme, partial [Erysipelotrichaceae bacterium]|nr:aminotransferase class V-fold PLP-dependent enzyme [Erysipelotrichaceae bacterium]